MKKIRLFFSWQSDIPENHCNIRNALMNACNTIKEEGEYDIQYTESTWGTSGSPVIEKVVMEKAKDCDIFVADITPVINSDKKSIPNPNVMMELGVAKSSLVDDVTLLLYTGEIEANRMPFDFNHQRMSQFSKKTITDYIRMMAETAVKNPRHTSLFDNNDRFLFYDRNIKKNISSGKYLPNVYLENRDIKQHLRDFVAPYPFCKLVLERCDKIDTYRINRDRRFLHKAPFSFDVSKFKSTPSEELLPDFYQKTGELRDYLDGKYKELHNNDSHYLSSSKYGKQVIHLDYIIGKLLLITTKAGQGKTNLICDLVDNVLLKRKIPFVFLNGYEINPNDICDSFTRAMLPTSKVSFDEVMQHMATYCRYRRSPIILIIDGLNENPEPNTFARNLELFLEAVLQYDCVKVIMTCRTDFYKEQFCSLDAVFKDRIIKIENLNKHFDEDDSERLLENYFEYFKIKAQLGSYVKESLCENLLLLRIFCEANKNKNMGFIHSIKREELFTEYYDNMTENLIKKVREEGNYTLSSNRVKTFITHLVEFMITNKQFFNVPLSYLEDKLNDEEKNIFLRFLDDNILLRKDLTPDAKGFYARNEVVNFTYDAFRDYLLSSYLSDILYSNDHNSYEKCIKEFTAKGQQLREGITPFLFVHTKIKGDKNAINFLSSLDWFEDVFKGYIWDIPEKLINNEDINLVFRILSSDDPKYVARRLIFYGRWDDSAYPKLNIKVLLEYLPTLDDNELKTFIERVWNDKHNKWGWNSDKDKTEREHIIEGIDNVLKEERVYNNEHFHNLFELLLYIAVSSDGKGFDTFMKYFKKYTPIEMIERVITKTRSNKLIIKLEEIKNIR